MKYHPGQIVEYNLPNPKGKGHPNIRGVALITDTEQLHDQTGYLCEKSPGGNDLLLYENEIHTVVGEAKLNTNWSERFQTPAKLAAATQYNYINKIKEDHMPYIDNQDGTIDVWIKHPQAKTVIDGLVQDYLAMQTSYLELEVPTQYGDVVILTLSKKGAIILAQRNQQLEDELAKMRSDMEYLKGLTDSITEKYRKARS
jgi:hypothetical protein